MSDPSSAELAIREPAAAVPLPPMDDAEIAAAYRAAKGFAESGLFKDAKGAGQAFTKIMAGRDLGLTPFESMSALHVYDGKVEMSADLHATRVRLHPDYDYKVQEFTAERCAVLFTRLSDGDTFLSEWTAEDTQKAGLSNKPNHKNYPRAMNFARAMTQGVTTFCPEVMGGVRVYAPGEIPRDTDPTDIDGDAAEVDVELPTAVEAIVARARTLGYAPLSNRSAVAMAVDGQPEEFVRAWAQGATRDLNRYAQGKPPVEPEAEAEPPEAEVVTPATDEPAPDPEPIDATIANADEAERIEALRSRALDLLAEADGLDVAGDSRAEEVREEVERIMAEVDAATTPEQGRLGL
jgi:hypothetical protein